MDETIRRDRLGRRIPSGHPRKNWNSARVACEKGLVHRQPGICQRCGQQHWLCSGHSDVYDNGDYKTGTKIGEKPCEKWVMKGQQVCSTHGGRGRNRKAARRQWEKETKQANETARLERAVRAFGLSLEISPERALLEEIYRTAGHVRWLGDQIGALTPEQLTWDTASEERRHGMTGIRKGAVDLITTVNQARPSVLVELYQNERAHLVRVCRIALKCGIAERQVKIVEEQGRLIADVFRRALEDPELGLDAEVRLRARLVVSRHLRLLAAKERGPSPSVVEQLPAEPDGQSEDGEG